MASNPRRTAETTSHPPAALAAPVQEPPTGGIPDWEFTVHPRELAFYQFHIEKLNETNQGIAAIARTLIQAHLHDELYDHDDAKLGWFNANIRYGLLRAVESLSNYASHPIEFMQERAEQYAPERAEEEGFAND